MPTDFLIRAMPSDGDTALHGRAWANAGELEISHFHAKSSTHHPRTRVRALHDNANIFLRFEVDDRFVVSQSTRYQDMVCFDSCVEFFFRPKADLGYFNLEINCGGTCLFYYVRDPTPAPGGFVDFTRVAPEHGQQLAIQHSLPSVVFPERTEPTPWTITCRLPLAALEPYTGPIPPLANSHWAANFYKCADHSTHPHWGSWSPIGEALNFHAPKYFGTIRFE